MALSQRIARVGKTIEGMKEGIARKGNQRGENKRMEDTCKKESYTIP